MNDNKTTINCEKTIYINIYSNYWKYSLFNIELFTFYRLKKEVNYD